MKVVVHLHGPLRRYGGPGGVAQVEMPAGSTLLDIVERLGIPKGMWVLACIRGELISPEKPLEGEAEISLFPPVSGG